MKMSVDFNREVDRRSTSDVKWRPEGLKGYLPIEVSENEIPMWIADMDFACPECIVRAIKERADKEIFGYCSYKQEYYDALTWWFDKRFGMKIHTDLVSMMPTVVSAINVAIRAFSNPGDKVIIQQPVYDPFAELIKKTGRVMVNNGLICNDGLYEMDFPLLEEQAADPDAKIMILCSPHNPVGRVWTREELERVAQVCLKYNVIWMVDEMHCDFIFPGHTFTSCMNLDEKYREILALYSSPGKTFNVAGLQPANIIIPNEELRKKYQWANTQAAYSQGSLMGQLAVKVCYTKGAEWVDELVQYIYENVKYMSKFVKENFPKAKMVEPEGTYLVWVDFSGYGLSNEELEHLMLEEAKLWLDSGIIFGPETAQFERFNVACPRVTLEQALTQLKDALDKHLAN